MNRCHARPKLFPRTVDYIWGEWKNGDRERERQKGKLGKLKITDNCWISRISCVHSANFSIHSSFPRFSLFFVCCGVHTAPRLLLDVFVIFRITTFDYTDDCGRERAKTHWNGKLEDCLEQTFHFTVHEINESNILDSSKIWRWKILIKNYELWTSAAAATTGEGFASSTLCTEH